MGSDDALSSTQARLIPLIHTDFLPEEDIANNVSLREDYENLRITYELQRDIGKVCYD